jgi:hypothetical protein
MFDRAAKSLSKKQQALPPSIEGWVQGGMCTHLIFNNS